MRKDIIANAASRGVSPQLFVPYLLLAIQEGDADERHFAVDTFVMKVVERRGVNVESFDNVLNAAGLETSVKQYVDLLAELGTAFSHDRLDETKHEAIVGMLIDRDPFDSILTQPYCCSQPAHTMPSVAARWRKLVEVFPRNVTILNHAAQFFVLSDYSMSRACFKRCADLDPDNRIWLHELNELESLYEE